MTRSLRLSQSMLDVCAEFLERPSRWRYGYDLMTDTDISAGTLYPILQRLTDRKWLETRWESELVEGRPARHMYRLTADGVAAAREFRLRARERGWMTGTLRPGEST